MCRQELLKILLLDNTTKYIIYTGSRTWATEMYESGHNTFRLCVCSSQKEPPHILCWRSLCIWNTGRRAAWCCIMKTRKRSLLKVFLRLPRMFKSAMRLAIQKFVCNYWLFYCNEAASVWSNLVSIPLSMRVGVYFIFAVYFIKHSLNIRGWQWLIPFVV